MPEACARCDDRAMLTRQAVAADGVGVGFAVLAAWRAGRGRGRGIEAIDARE